MKIIEFDLLSGLKFGWTIPLHKKSDNQILLLLILHLYNMILYLYGKAMQIAALKNPKAKLWVEGRQNTFQYLEENVSESDDIIWIHPFFR